jgi:hypothetical protein
MGEEKAGVCKALPDYLLQGYDDFGKKKVKGVETSLIEKHFTPPKINDIPLYMKVKAVPGLKKYKKHIEQILKIAAE